MRRRLVLLLLAFLTAAGPAGPALAAPTPVTAPTGLSAVAESARSVRLTWTPASDATGYVVYWGVEAQFLDVLAETTAATYTHAYLAPGETYLYGVAKRTRKGTSPISPLVAVTTPPEPPGGLSAEAETADRVRLSWYPGSGATSYAVTTVAADGAESPADVRDSTDRGALVAATAASTLTFRVRSTANSLSSYEAVDATVTTPPKDTSVINLDEVLPVASGDTQLSFRVDGANQRWAASGTLDVALDGGPATTVPVTDNLAALPVSLSPGTHQVRADYSGDGAFEPSSMTRSFDVADRTPTYRAEVLDESRSVASAEVADVTCDGRADLVSSSSTFDPQTGETTASLDVRAASADGSLGAPQRRAGAASALNAWSMDAGDLTGDGCADLAFVSSTLYTATGTAAGLAAPVQVKGLTGTSSVRLADLTGDARVDAVVNTATSTTLLPGNGRGGFGRAKVIGPPVDRFEVGDVDGDGRLDLLVATQDEAQAWTQSSTGSFSVLWRTQVMLTGAPTTAVADVDGDGAADLVLNGGYGLVLSGRDGAATSATGDGPEASSVAAGDVDADGDADLVASTWSSWPISVALTAAGRPTYLQTVFVEDVYGVTPGALRVGDIGSDGTAEIVAPDSGRLVVLRRT